MACALFRVSGSVLAVTNMLPIPSRLYISCAASIPSRGPASRISISTTSGRSDEAMFRASSAEIAIATTTCPSASSSSWAGCNWRPDQRPPDRCRRRRQWECSWSQPSPPARLVAPVQGSRSPDGGGGRPPEPEGAHIGRPPNAFRSKRRGPEKNHFLPGRGGTGPDVALPRVRRWR
jgi:hypothetical protein